MRKPKRLYTIDRDRHGNFRYYFRRTGQQKIRLQGNPGSVEFEESLNRALAGVSSQSARTVGRHREGSFRHLCFLYFASLAFKRLAPATQNWRRRALEVICKDYGHNDAGKLTSKMIRILRDQLADRPGASRNRVKALKALFGWAVEEDLAKDDPTRGVKLIQYVSKPHHSWTLEEVEQFEKHHPIGTKARLALALLLYTSWRRGDAVRLGRQHIVEETTKDGTKRNWIKYRLEKNERRRPSDMDIPLRPELEEIISRTESGHLTFLVTKDGKPYTKYGFGNRFKDWCMDANLPHCSCHGLRSATASRLAERGATDFEIMAITGHKSLSEVQRYTRSARTKVMADSAMNKLK